MQQSLGTERRRQLPREAMRRINFQRCRDVLTRGIQAIQLDLGVCQMRERVGVRGIKPHGFI